MTKPKPKEEHKKRGPKGPSKWDLEAAMGLAEELIEWMEVEEENIFVGEFLCRHKGLYGQLASDLCNRFPEFAEIYKKATKIQEYKLAKLLTTTRINPGGVIFLLKNHHGYEDKRTVESTNVNITADRKELAAKTPEQLKDIVRQLSAKAAN